MMQQRKAGILLHISSLPGAYGIGDIGSSLSFIPFLQRGGIGCWQFLPTSPVAEAFGYSPYMGYSALAGNPLFISPEMLVEDGFLDEADLPPLKGASPYVVDFPLAKEVRTGLIQKSYARLGGHFPGEFTLFCRQHGHWLDDYALFMALKDEFAQKSWTKWPREFQSRDKAALSLFAKSHEQQLLYVKFEQFIFFSQWQKLRGVAAKHGVSLFGDIPIYVGHDSADVWAHQSCFELDPVTGEPLSVAGVPPDYFSETGQRWGNPLYRWQSGGRKNERLYRWWQHRFEQICLMVDQVRIDHFRGFESYWSIDQSEETAINGTWVQGPGIAFFKAMEKSVAGLEIIAEDLGIITPEVEALRDECGFPGMKILQFAFGGDETNSYLPQNYETTNTVVYGGTHDNDTAVGWFLDPGISEQEKGRFRQLANSDGSSPHYDFNRLAWSSTARLAIISMQDVLGFGTDCRMNKPGTVENNWLWRLGAEDLSAEVAKYLQGEVTFYNRRNLPAKDFDNQADVG
jgi:4-alpha-glucanotransferase